MNVIDVDENQFSAQKVTKLRKIETDLSKNTMCTPEEISKGRNIVREAHLLRGKQTNQK